MLWARCVCVSVLYASNLVLFLAFGSLIFIIVIVLAHYFGVVHWNSALLYANFMIVVMECGIWAYKALISNYILTHVWNLLAIMKYVIYLFIFSIKREGSRVWQIMSSYGNYAKPFNTSISISVNTEGNYIKLFTTSMNVSMNNFFLQCHAFQTVSFYMLQKRSLLDNYRKRFWHSFYDYQSILE